MTYDYELVNEWIDNNFMFNLPDARVVGRRKKNSK